MRGEDTIGIESNEGAWAKPITNPIRVNKGESNKKFKPQLAKIEKTSFEGGELILTPRP